jgi:ribosomal protein L11 methyltransferase
VLPPASFLAKDVDFGARFGDYRTYDDVMEEPTEQFDIVVANILPGPLTQLAPTLLALLKPGGRLAIAGCQEHQVTQLQDVYRAVGLPLETRLKEHVGGKWVLLEGTKL